MAQEGDVMSRMADPDASIILSENHVQDPLEAVFHKPAKSMLPPVKNVLY